MTASSKRMGTLVQPFKNPTLPTVLARHQFIVKNKRLTLLSQCKLAFIRRNVSMGLKIQKDTKKYKKNLARRLF